MTILKPDIIIDASGVYWPASVCEVDEANNWVAPGGTVGKKLVIDTDEMYSDIAAANDATKLLERYIAQLTAIVLYGPTAKSLNEADATAAEFRRMFT